MNKKIRGSLLRLLLILFVPFFVLTFLRFFYFSQPAGVITVDYKCETKDQQETEITGFGFNCARERSGDRETKLNEQIEEKSRGLKFIEDFTHFPFSTYISYNLSLVNLTKARLTISDTDQIITNKVDLKCGNESMPYGKKIKSQQKLNLKSLDSDFNNAIDSTIRECLPEENNLKFSSVFDWPKGSFLTVSVDEQYKYSMSLDFESQFILYLIILIVESSLLPLIKQMVQFISQGNKYFTK